MKCDYKRPLLPQYIDFLVVPVLAAWFKLEIIFKKQASHNEAHFHDGETADKH